MSKTNEPDEGTENAEKQVRCPDCSGSGDCAKCHGAGYPPGSSEVCALCNGSGECWTCYGTGWLAADKGDKLEEEPVFGYECRDCPSADPPRPRKRPASAGLRRSASALYATLSDAAGLLSGAGPWSWQWSPC